MTEAWSPLGQGDVVTNEAIPRSPRDWSGRPRRPFSGGTSSAATSSSRARTRHDYIADNIRLFDFELAADDMAAITALDRGAAGRKGPDPDTFDWVPD